jgi:RHS repeat-associated protein
VTDTYQYEAFGNLTGSTGSTPNPYRYVGSLGYYQTGTSLRHLGARYYMRELGRFFQRDRVVRPSSSAYPYVEGGPTVRVDPDGEFPWLIIGGVVIIGVVSWQGYECAQAVRWSGRCQRIARDIYNQIEPEATADPENCPTEHDLWQRAWERANRTQTCRNARYYAERCYVVHMP